jgi:hypothetical protein
MPSSPKRNKEDRLFVRQGRRHYRPRHSMAEVRIGGVILLALALLMAWIAWKGANPDPALFDVSAALLESSPAPVDRGPLPTGLEGPGWREVAVSAFDASNLYEKINGREDYYKSFGFERLYFASLVREDDPTVTVDIELFDQGNAPNALGAFAGERPATAASRIEDGSMVALARNALLMTRGRYYVRAIGSEESPRIDAQLEHLTQVMSTGLEAEALPWAYALFVGGLRFDPGRVSYAPENAYSFGFARDVYSVLLDDEETESFIVATPSTEAAEELAARFTGGFLDYGSAAGERAGVSWVKDRYIDSVSGARPHRSWVVGVYGAPSVERAAQALGRLVAGVDALPEGVAERAVQEPQAEAPAAGDTDEPGESETDYGDTESPSEYEP